LLKYPRKAELIADPTGTTVSGTMKRISGLLLDWDPASGTGSSGMTKVRRVTKAPEPPDPSARIIDQDDGIEAMLKHCGKWRESTPRPPPKIPEPVPFGEHVLDHQFFENLCN
jgi:hypothetical protein